jgi:serine/threonine protein kinase
MYKGIKYHRKYIMSKKPLGLVNPSSFSIFNPMANPLQEVDAYITGLPETIPKIGADSVKTFIQNGTALNAGAFGQTYINRDRTNVMKMIDLQKRYDMLLNYSKDKINSIIIGELKNEIEYYHTISRLCENVCKFLGYYYDTVSKTVYILMENCGTDLFDIYAQNERPSLEQSIGYIKQIVEALVCLHTNGFAHRDLKPENITLTAQGKILLIDFGFLTKDGDIIVPGKGTALYKSPENMGDKLLSFEELMASDIYSLGVIIMFMLLKDYDILFNTTSHTEYIIVILL